jgi:hypothetical protein
LPILVKDLNGHSQPIQQVTIIPTTYQTKREKNKCSQANGSATCIRKMTGFAVIYPLIDWGATSQLLIFLEKTGIYIAVA